jgi:hypothetical protein
MKVSLRRVRGSRSTLATFLGLQQQHAIRPSRWDRFIEGSRLASLGAIRSYGPLVFLLCLLRLLCLSCAGPQLSADPIDWQRTDEDRSVHIVTLDPDGSERSTRIWLASVGDRGALRTGDGRVWRTSLHRLLEAWREGTSDAEREA